MKIRPLAISVTECRAVVAYCDVTGFMNWVKRSAGSREDVAAFIKGMRLVFRQFRDETGFRTIPIGDGIIALLIHAEKRRPPRLKNFLLSLLVLHRRMNRLIKGATYPRPAGFRIRVTAGPIFQIQEGHALDFIGDCLNLGSRLCEVRREHPAIIHASAYELLSINERRELRVQKLLITDRPPRGVDPADMNDLATFGPSGPK